jgi:hypothetical protein
MIKNMKNIILLWVLLMTASCVGTGTPPVLLEKSPVSPWYYTFTVILIPEALSDSPRLEIALALVQVNYPQEQAEFLNDLLYSADSLEAYKDRIIQVKRDEARKLIAASQDRYDMRYAEKIHINNPESDGIVIERDYETYLGGAHGLETKTYYVVDLDELRLIKVDDIFGNFQGNNIRELVYTELRKYGNLEPGQPLSEGIFDKDEPELSFNFFFTDEGLGLHWDPYQIAPFSEGSIEIILPWRSIRPLMLQSGMELLTKFGIHLFVE